MDIPTQERVVKKELLKGDYQITEHKNRPENSFTGVGSGDKPLVADTFCRDT